MREKQEPRLVSLSYLRAFVTLLVVAHHAALAYTTFNKMPNQMPRMPSFTARPLLWTAYPVIDRGGWPGFDVFVGWNDMFFMALMFFISGLFVWPSLRQKGAAAYLKRRFVRLGVPFIFSAAILAPLAYFPAYLLFGASPRLSAYARAWLSLGSWPAGPAWFLWVLLVFDCVAAAAYLAVPRVVPFLARFWAQAGARPILVYLALTALSMAAYLPPAKIFGPFQWSSFGPFFFQTSRGLHYFVYFFVGACTGTLGTHVGLFDAAGKLARRWPMWGGIAIVAFAAVAAATVAAKPLAAAIFFPFSCAASSLFLIAVFVRFSAQSRVADSLSNNAYGIYLLHYIFVIWLQWALLLLDLPAVLKGFVVVAGAVGLSWVTSALVRRNRTIAQVV
jgi:peptidoglycan/LPS O-acetylase OafA/YrhL